MIKRCIAISFFLIFTSQLAAQGPISGFMPNPGQVDAAFTYSQENYSSFFDTDGEPTSRILDAYSYNFYVEYGLDAKTALVATLPYISNNEQNQGLQDGSLWLKYRNERKKRPLGFNNFITAIGISFPVSQYPSDNPLAIGRRATTFQGRVLWQHEANYGWFVHVQSGIDFQLAPQAQAALPILVRTGIGTKYYYVDVWLEQYQALQSTANSANLSAGPGSTWTRAGGTLYFPLTPWFGAFTGGAIVLGGKNIGKSTRWNLGVVFRAGG